MRSINSTKTTTTTETVSTIASESTVSNTSNNINIRARSRAPRACKSCASSKIKCDVSQTGSPCTKCSQQHRPCVVLPTRRGKYCRKTMKEATVTKKDSTYSENGDTLSHESSSESWNTDQLLALGVLVNDHKSASHKRQKSQEEITAKDISSPIRTDILTSPLESGYPSPSETASVTTPLPVAATKIERENDEEPTTIRSQIPRQTVDDEETTENRLWVNLLNASSQAISQESSGPTSAYVPEVYTLTHVIRNHWAEDHPENNDDIDVGQNAGSNSDNDNDNETKFRASSCNGTNNVRVHYPEDILAVNNNNFSSSSSNQKRSKSSKIPPLFRGDSLLDTKKTSQNFIYEGDGNSIMARLPEQVLANDIVAAYFATTHLTFPIIDRRDFITAYLDAYADQDNSVYLSLVFAILAVGSRLCKMEVLEKAGYTSRLSALAAFATSANRFVRATSRNSKICVIQTSFILGQVWMNPDSHDDTYWHVGQAISVALSMGMHRSAASSRMPHRYQSLFKRIFWCCYIRDRHSAAATGRPYRIVDTFCDVELPAMYDFELEFGRNDGFAMNEKEKEISNLLGRDSIESALYFIEHAKLCKILTEILECLMTPILKEDARHEQRLRCIKHIQEWKNSLPKAMQLKDDVVSNRLVTDLHMSYSCWMIHLCRSEAGKRPSSTSHYASAAAGAIARHLEEFVATETIQLAASHIIPALFATMAQLVQDSRYSTTNAGAKLAINKLHLTMIAARELANSHPTSGWCLKLFLGVQASVRRRLKQRNSSGDSLGKECSGNGNTKKRKLHQQDGSGFSCQGQQTKKISIQGNLNSEESKKETHSFSSHHLQQAASQHIDTIQDLVGSSIPKTNVSRNHNEQDMMTVASISPSLSSTTAGGSTVSLFQDQLNNNNIIPSSSSACITPDNFISALAFGMENDHIDSRANGNNYGEMNNFGNVTSNNNYHNNQEYGYSRRRLDIFDDNFLSTFITLDGSGTNVDLSELLDLGDIGTQLGGTFM